MSRDFQTPQSDANHAPADGEAVSGKPASGSPRKRRSGQKATARFKRFLTATGLLLIRRYRFVRRRVCSAAGFAISTVLRVRNSVLRNIRVFAVRNGIAIDGVTRRYRALADGSRAARKQSPGALARYWALCALQALVRGVRCLFSSVNYAAPLAAAVVFLTVVHVTLSMTYALAVTYNGEEIGYIADESVFEQAEKQMRGRIVLEDYIRPDDSIPAFTIVAVHRDQLLSEDALTDRLIRASGNELAEAAGLYVDDQFLGAVTERALLLNLLDSLKDSYRTDNLYETVEFVKRVEARDGLYPLTSICSIEKMEELVNREESQQRIYTAVKGDAPITIAQKNGIPYAQIKALNPGIETSLLVGQEVLVQKSVPLLEVKVVRREIVEEETSFKIEQIQDTSQFQGYVKITQQGKKGLNEVTYETTYVDGLETTRIVLDTRVVREPINEKVVVGGKRPLEQIPAAAKTTSSNFIWPTASGYVSCRINGYWGHTGLDIASGYGTGIYASASGTVTKVVYNTYGYGYHVIISHGGGVETLYAHNSALHVKVGDWVEQGQLIASMGRTGKATGNHLHFEIRINGRYMDPEKYIGSVCPY